MQENPGASQKLFTFIFYHFVLVPAQFPRLSFVVFTIFLNLMHACIFVSLFLLFFFSFNYIHSDLYHRAVSETYVAVSYKFLKEICKTNTVGTYPTGSIVLEMEVVLYLNGWISRSWNCMKRRLSVCVCVYICNLHFLWTKLVGKYLNIDINTSYSLSFD